MGTPIAEEPVQGYAGDEWVIELQFKQPDNTPFNLSGFTTFRSEWRVQEYNPYNVKTLEVIPHDLVGGKLRIRATTEQTSTMNSDGVIDVFADEKQTLIKFRTELIEDVTL
jgi:hypothetical protein